MDSPVEKKKIYPIWDYRLIYNILNFNNKNIFVF